MTQAQENRMSDHDRATPRPWTVAYPVPPDGTADVRRANPREQFTVRRDEGASLAARLNAHDTLRAALHDYEAALRDRSRLTRASPPTWLGRVRGAGMLSAKNCTEESPDGPGEAWC